MTVRQEETATIQLRQLFESDVLSIRVIYCDCSLIILINIQNKEIIRMSPADFTDYIHAGKFQLTCELTPSGKVSPHHMTKAAMKQNECEKVLLASFPDWDKLFQRKTQKPYIDGAVERLGISRQAFRIILYKYLLSGRNITSLIDQRCHNHSVLRFNSDYTEPFEYALKIFKSKKNAFDAYDEMIEKYYICQEETKEECRNVLDENRPSYKQFYNYLKHSLGGMGITDYKKGIRDYTNNRRPLPGNAQYGVFAIGQMFEIDEVEMDCYLVSDRNPSIVIGKAIVYVCVDVKSCMVVAAKAGLKNNSYSGFCDVMLTLLEEHSKQAKMVGAECDDSIFPSLVMPAAVRCDHGSEYESKAMEKACREIGMDVSIVPVATGSMKGLVERFHGRMQHLLSDLLKNAGFINKISGVQPDPSVHRNAKEKACLTMSDISKIIFDAVSFINQAPLESYDPDADMLYEGMVLSPFNIWNHEIRHSINPVNVTRENREFYLFGFLNRSNGDRHDRKFKIGRSGITYRNSLKYFVDEPWFWQMIKKGVNQLDIRYLDSRIDYIWVRDGRTLHIIPLSEKRDQFMSYKGISWNEFDVLDRMRKKNTKEELETANRLRKAATKRKIKETVSIAKKVKSDKENSLEDIKEARYDELLTNEADWRTDRNRILQNTFLLPEDPEIIIHKTKDAVEERPENDYTQSIKTAISRDYLISLAEEEY